MDQTKLTNFLNAGKSFYIEGNNIGYHNYKTDFYNDMLGVTFDILRNGISTLSGQSGSIVEGKDYNFLKDLNSNLNGYMDRISANGGNEIFKCNESFLRAVTYEGQDNNYKLIYSTFNLGGIRTKDAKNELMKIYMNYLLGNTSTIKDFQISSKRGTKNISNVFISTNNKNKYLNFNVSTPSNIKGNIYNLSGKSISIICNKEFDKGNYKIPINSLNIGSGIFLLELECNGTFIRQAFNNLK